MFHHIPTHPKHFYAKLTSILEQEIVECASDFRDLLQEGSLVERKAFVRSIVNEVRVTGEQILVNYKIPMSTHKLKEEKNPVLDIVHYGGR
jgi:site-specific DNA recombinase